MFEKLVQAHYKAILSYCTMKLRGDVHAAEDCTQEVFLLLHRKLPELTDSNLAGWLYAAADRAVLTYRRKNPVLPDADDYPEPSEEPPEPGVLDELEENDRRLLSAYYAGADRNALAASLGVSVEALYQRVHRLRERIRRRLQERRI